MATLRQPETMAPRRLARAARGRAHGAEQVVTAGDFYDRDGDAPSRTLKGDHRRSEGLLRGRSGVMRLRDGLSVHFSDAEDLKDFVIERDCAPNLGVKIFLEGAVEATVGGVPVPMPEKAESGWQPIGCIFAQSRTERFVRRTRKGVHVRKVSIAITPEWLEAGAADTGFDLDKIRRFASCHLAWRTWRPSNRAIAMAEQIINPPDQPPVLSGLYLESRVLALVAEAFEQILSVAPGADDARLRPHDRKRLRRVEEWLSAHSEGPVSADRLASEIGSSTNTLQRLFQAAYGMSVYSYIRLWKLRQARQALEAGGISIAEAAYLAGYASPANFATAFKRQFGLSPRDVQVAL
ncbi:helix-turn-helix transcriptional regulator [Rhodobium gokarnense]|uniref:AraC-like DNA-binding protein n=1 Tax=Rhodobium gokarnense TaxID=364296 RepID=A0ABT3HBD5_9HYPH|nr:AraC family transcriptional regulator [Rhodobium gokarnense]MCW2307695.1 AraC-like DNA-binding protein [Rhodobium gokarnense]